MAPRGSDKLTRAASEAQPPTKPSGRRQAPPIAAKNAEVARLNIVTKLDILGDYLAYAAGGLQSATSTSSSLTLADVPRSTRQFNGWESATLRSEVQPLLPKFAKNSNATLKKHAELCDLVVQRTSTIGKNTDQSSDKEEARATLLRKLSLANQLRQIAEKELIRARRELADERSKVDGLEGEVVSTTAKAKEQFKDLKSQITTLRLENARLTTLAKQATKLKAV